MKRRQFVLVALGTTVLAACSADTAGAMVVYKDPA